MGFILMIPVAMVAIACAVSAAYLAGFVLAWLGCCLRYLITGRR
jgi:hypothetical protein